MSISISCGSSHTISETRSSTFSTASMFAGGRFRNCVSMRAARVRAIRLRVMKRFSGGSATARSRSTSTMVPPAPKVMTGPKARSRVTPTSSSRPWLASNMRSTVTPTIRAFGNCFWISVMSSL